MSHSCQPQLLASASTHVLEVSNVQHPGESGGHGLGPTDLGVDVLLPPSYFVAALCFIFELLPSAAGATWRISTHCMWLILLLASCHRITNWSTLSAISSNTKAANSIN